MRRKRWQVLLAATLIILAVALYWVRWVLFPDPALQNEMVRFLVGDVAFLFVQVLLVSLVLDGIMQRREREEMLKKLNMVIGSFFSETGSSLLGEIARADVHLPEVRDQLVPTTTWGPADYARARTAFDAHTPRIELDACDLSQLRDRLEKERSFIIGLLSNQNLLEHEEFTDLLWALTHLGEELCFRPDLAHLGTADSIHIAGDVKRAYKLLGSQWLSYLSHLQSQYPFLFSLAVRTNPLDPSARVEVAE